MYTRNIAVKLTVLILIIGLWAYPSFAYGPQDEILDLELNAEYVELEYGYDAPLDMRGFQFIATSDGEICPNLVWTLSNTDYLEVSKDGYVSVCNGQGNFEGKQLITLSCSTANGCVQSEAKIMLLPPTPLGIAPSIPKAINPRPSMFTTYQDMTMDFIVPMNQLAVIKYNRNKNPSPLPVTPMATHNHYVYTFDYRNYLIMPKGGQNKGPNEVSPHVSVVLNTDAIKLFYGGYTSPDHMTYDFDAFVIGTSYREVQWELSDDQYIQVNDMGVVTLKAIPAGTGDFEVILTVSTMDGWKQDTAVISIVENRLYALK